MNHVSRCHFGSNVWCFVAYRSEGDVAETLTMANRSLAARNAAKTVPAPVGQAAPGDVAVKVSTFLELAPGIPNSPANLAKLQKILKDGRPGRCNGGGVHKGYCRKLGRVLVRIWWKKPRWVFALHRAEKCKKGQTHVLIEEERTPQDFLEGLLRLQERVGAVRKFGFCKKCDQELPDIEMHCSDCVITSVLEASNNAD